MGDHSRMKRLLKSITNWICLIIVFPFFLAYSLLGACGRKDSIFASFSQFFSLIPGRTGSYLRKGFYRFSMTQCDKDCAIVFGTIFSHVDTEIGKGAYIGAHCNIGMCKIEKHCTIGSNVHIMSGKEQHSFEEIETPIQMQGGRFRKVVIGEDTWIGNGALVMANVGKKCIVGAGSVVAEDVEDYSIVAGNPARMIRKRDK